MRKMLLLGTMLWVAHAALAQKIDPTKMGKSKPDPIPINLDLPVHERYAKLHQNFASTLAGLANDIVSKAKKELGGNFTFMLLETIIRFFYFTRTQPDMFDEIMEVSKATGVSATTLVFFNFYYEADGTACSSIVARQSNQEILFGSNLDFVFFKNIKKLTFFGQYFKQNKLLYESNSIYGLVG